MKTTRASVNRNTQNTVHAHSEIFICEKNEVWVYVTTWVDLENMSSDLGSHRKADIHDAPSVGSPQWADS